MIFFRGLRMGDEDAEKLEKERTARIAKSFSVPYGRIFELTRPEFWAYGPAFFGAILYGLSLPLFAYLLAYATAGIYNSDKEGREEGRKEGTCA